MRSRLLTLGLVVCICAGCGQMPRHSNTLIFGTGTRFAVDVSQDPTTGPSVTIGYKRQEAVWMPLLPNKSKDLEPVSCDTENTCSKFVGIEGSNRDTYSVIATFSGQAGAETDQPNAKVGIAQFFATGLAARTLAAQGGAALVNSTPEAAQTAPAAVKAANAKVIMVQDRNVERIIAHVATKEGRIDATKRDALIAAATLNAADKLSVQRPKTADDLRIHLQDEYDALGKRLYDALP